MFTKIADLDISCHHLESILLVVDALTNTCRLDNHKEIVRKFFSHWKGYMKKKRASFIMFHDCVDHALDIVEQNYKLGYAIEESVAFLLLIAILELIAWATVIENKKNVETLKGWGIDLEELINKVRERIFCLKQRIFLHIANGSSVLQFVSQHI